MDPIANMLIQIKNASLAGLPSVNVPFSNIKMEIAKILQKEGYLKNVVKRGKKVKKILSCDLVYNTENKPKVSDVARVSKPSRRVYCRVGEIKPVLGGYGISVLSTPKGLLTDKDAKKERVGGEVLFKIW